MIQITNLTDAPYQLTSVTLSDGTVLSISLQYFPTIQRWMMSLSYPSPAPTFVMNGVNLCAAPNILRQWKNVLEFGLSCQTTDGLDPAFIEDFENGRVTLYVLTAAEVAQTETTVYGSGVNTE